MITLLPYVNSCMKPNFGLTVLRIDQEASWCDGRSCRVGGGGGIETGSIAAPATRLRRFPKQQWRSQRYQIKGRAVDPTDRYRGRVPAIQYDRNFEWVLLVLLDRSTYSALEIWQASRQNVRARLEAPGSRARNERNSMGITQFVSIARKVWPQQDQAAGTADAREGGERERSKESQPTRKHRHTANNKGAQMGKVRACTETGWAEEKMTRECAIRHGNQRCTSAAMQGHNTHFSNINTSKDVWWLDIPKRKIEQPSTDALHLLLCDDRLGEQRFYHLQVPISYLQKNIRDFRIRDDTDKIHLELRDCRV